MSWTYLYFTQWLRTQIDRQDGIGDVARDMVAPNAQGIHCCSRFRNYNTLRRHILQAHHPCESALRCLDKALKEWKGL